MERSPDTIRSITHDIRNLLTAVRGHAELALRGLSSDDPVREDVAHVVVVTASVFDLVDQLEGNTASDRFIAVSLDPTVASMRRLLDALLPPSIELVVSTGSAGAYVTIPKLRIERIVLNLVLNARDAMEDGGRLGVATRPGADGEVHIVVSDTGPGFAEEALTHLFEDGYTTKAEGGGTGRGLAALKRFLDGVHGSIVVDSLPGEGATVTVTLPSVSLEEVAAATAAAPSGTATRDDEAVARDGVVVRDGAIAPLEG